MTRFSKIPELNRLSNSFVQKFSVLSIDDVSLYPYNEKYLRRYLENIEYNTYIAATIAQHFWSNKDLRIIDLGGGIGFNAAYFRHIGFSDVVLLDHDKQCVVDAHKIHSALGLSITNYVCGNVQWFKNQNLENSVIASRDVIEHIYDLSAFFLLSAGAFINVHNTAAIHNSIFRKKEFENIHYKAENLGFKGEGLKALDSSLPYSELRRKHIQKNYPTSQNLDDLVKDTRGLNLGDIDRFIADKHYDEVAKQHLYTNTCNPNTGNWAERTLPFEAYRLFGKAAGIDNLQIELLKYNTYNQHSLKKAGLAILNKVIELSQNQRLAPSFSLIY